jgi:hypothetical protein
MFISVHGVPRIAGASVAVYGLGAEVSTTTIVHLTLTGRVADNSNIILVSTHVDISTGAAGESFLTTITVDLVQEYRSTCLSPETIHTHNLNLIFNLK